MSLYEIGLRAAARFDRVGIDRALAQNPAPVEIMFTFENPLLHLDELLTDHVALPLGLGHPRQCGEKQFARVFHKERARAERREMRAHKFGFTLAHHAGVYVSAMDPVRSQSAQAQ